MLTDDQRKTIEARLLTDRARTLQAIGELDESARELRERVGELSLWDQHRADYGSESQEQETQLLLASVEGRHLYALDEALSRLYREPERFGSCAECGREIGMERLEVVPETRLCAEHARARDAGVDAAPREADGRALRE